MSTAADQGMVRGPVGVVTAVAGRAESVVAAALSGRRDVVLVRRCADVAELLSVSEAGLAAAAVVGEGFPGLDADVVDRLRLNGCTVLGVVDPDRESSERLRAWGVVVVPVDPAQDHLPPAAGRAAAPSPAALAQAVLAAVTGGTAGAVAASPGAQGAPGGSGTSGTSGTSGPSGPSGRSGPSGTSGASDTSGRRARPRRTTGTVPEGRSAGTGTGTGPSPSAAATGGYSSPAPRVPGAAGGPGQDRSRPADAGGADVPGAAGASTAHVLDGGPGDHGAGWDPVGVDALVPAGAASRTGRLVAVWGPAGAPGRTTVAVTVAAELAAAGDEVLLVDADTYAGSVAQVLGLLDEAPGLVAAVRAGLEGRLEPATLARLAPVVSPRLRVLTGLTRAARWSELRPAGLDAVWVAGRRLAEHVVVDVASPLEEDDELSYDTAAPRRNAAAVEVLRAADHVLVVGSADPVGLQRLVRGLQDLAVVVPGVRPQVVVNRVRADAVGRNPRLRVREALERFAGVVDPCLVPDDRVSLDRALLAGRTLLEQAPGSPARGALRSLAVSLRGRRAASPGRARRRQATGG